MLPMILGTICPMENKFLHLLYSLPNHNLRASVYIVLVSRDMLEIEYMGFFSFYSPLRFLIIWFLMTQTCCRDW
jgi:hypothetical protein